MVRKRRRGDPWPIEGLAELFKTLGEPTRLRILDVLAGGERCVHEITEALTLEQSAVSHQLRILRDRGLVRGRREGRHVYYTLHDDHVREVITVAAEHLGHAHPRSKG